MKLEYCQSDTYNFGDDLNPWLWPQIFGDVFDDCNEEYFVGIGTLITKKRINKQLKDAKKIIIFSSGAWDENIPKLDERCHVIGVRGPRTANKLNISNDLVLGDGAYLLRKIILPAPKENIKYNIGFIPHHRSEDFINWEDVCNKIGVKFISPKQPVESFLCEIQTCNKVITEAMHGAIVADALRIPWIGVKFSPAFNEEKWYDFSEVMDIDLDIYPLTFMSQYKMKMGKLVENSIKTQLSKLLPCSPKWARLPIVYKLADDNELFKLGQEILSLDNNDYYLSSDDKVDEVTNRLYDKALFLRDYFNVK